MQFSKPPGHLTRMEAETSPGPSSGKSGLRLSIPSKNTSNVPKSPDLVERALRSSGMEEEVSNQEKQTLKPRFEERESKDASINPADLTKIEMLGSGAAGIVDKVRHTTTGRIFARKTVSLVNDEATMKSIQTELHTLMSCRSEYIVKCYGAYQHGTFLSYCLEYMDLGNLSDVLKVVGKIPEIIIGMIVCQVLKGLEYLHNEKRVIHRDIKPSNILVNSEGYVKIADFGVSGVLTTKPQRSSWVGTVTHMSPERLKGDPYTCDTDLWSLGLTVYELALGYFPYCDAKTGACNLGFFDLLTYINNNPAPSLPEDFSPEIRDFVSIWYLFLTRSQLNTEK
eukprot:TRINITY_DN2225_c0_g1_i3.p1 TRINITY_DN2225_c0_g1~~TRINITY_DN2225_c0_g1_i3.p1  ORF type:complete len:339 (-),score=23.79 TRINITY_DN2225_c0_g1_i3:249-1265(-)